MFGWERAHFDLQSLIKCAVLCIQSHRPAVKRTCTGRFYFFCPTAFSLGSSSKMRLSLLTSVYLFSVWHGATCPQTHTNVVVSDD